MQKEREERFCIEDVKHLIYHRKEEIMYVCVLYMCVYIFLGVIYICIMFNSLATNYIHMYIYTYIIV